MAEALGGRDIGGVFRLYRRLTGLSQTQLSMLVQIPQPRISLIESGRYHVKSLETFERIAAGLAIPPDRLGLAAAPARAGEWQAGLGKGGAAGQVAADRERWRSTRRNLNGHRAELTQVAAELYPANRRVGTSGLIAPEHWLTTEPVELEAIGLDYRPDAPSPLITGREDETRGMRPLRSPEHRYTRYTHALRDLDPPTLFENRVSYRLLDLRWNGPTGALAFGETTYFDMVDVCEAMAHEVAATHLRAGPDGPEIRAGRPRRLPFRRLIGDPFDLQRRALLPSIDTLTIRRDGDRSTFVLHQRDPAKVTVAGRLLHVMPAGVFQPSSILWDAHERDFDLWRAIMREYSEEFLGNPEHDGSGAPIDYAREEPFRTLDEARAQRLVRAYCFGIALDALTLVGEILTVVVIDAEVFDEVFLDLVSANSEGTVTRGDDPSVVGLPFTAEGIRTLLAPEALAPAAAGCIALAWRYREQILGG